MKDGNLTVGNLETIGKLRLLARVRVGSQEVAVANLARAQLVVGGTQFLRQNQSSSSANMPTLLLQEQQEYWHH